MSINRQTVIFKNKPKIIGHYSLVGPLEGAGPMKEYFDYILQDDTFGEKTFEKSERKILEHIIFNAIDSANLKPSDIELLLSGDLMNQIVSSSFAARKYDITYLGLYSACATMAESIALGACLVESGHFDKVCCATASHFSSAERQYRFPLELGNQRPPTSQWTITGGGGCVLAKNGKGACVSSITFGKIMDFGIKDVNNMGAAMAPAAMDTIEMHLKNTKTKVGDYDLIVTGDLGKLGSEILIDLLERKGIKLCKNYTDCGCIIFDKTDRVYMGGSGSGCSASILNGYIIKKIEKGEYKKVLLVATGALLSPTTSFQGDSIPCIAHAVCIEGGQNAI